MLRRVVRIFVCFLGCLSYIKQYILHIFLKLLICFPVCFFCEYFIGLWLVFMLGFYFFPVDRRCLGFVAFVCAVCISCQSMAVVPFAKHGL